jgi:hypothetical protein
MIAVQENEKKGSTGIPLLLMHCSVRKAVLGFFQMTFGKYQAKPSLAPQLSDCPLGFRDEQE